MQILKDTMQLVLIVISVISVVAEGNGQVTVETSFGSLIGSRPYPLLARSCEQWLGIPFAKPPVGPLRFSDPVLWADAYPASGRKATSYGAYCHQIGGGDEDCLYLNIWRPTRTVSGTGLAVMVWFHGGSFIAGAGSSMAPAIQPGVLNSYNGCTLSTLHDVIVSTLNYRLGPFGFTAFEEKGGHHGNFGMKDQRQALAWLQSELKAFGGDARRVTIFGESAGAESVFYHVASPVSKGLFRGAIAESGFPNAGAWSYRHQVTSEFASKLQCNDTASLRDCLRTKDAKDLIKNAWETDDPFKAPGWGPVVDGVDMPEHVVTMFHDRRQNPVAFMAGTNTDEGNLFVWPLFLSGMTEQQYTTFLTEVVTLYENNDPEAKVNATELAEIFAKYPVSDAKERRHLAASVFTDSSFVCGTHLAAKSHSEIADMFVYRFNHRSSCESIISPEVPGVYHGSELLYVWGTPESSACVLGPEEIALSLRIQKMWTNFAKNLTPLSTSEGFPKYTNGSRLNIVLQTPSDAIESDYRADYCQLWDDVLYSKLWYSGHNTYDVVV